MEKFLYGAYETKTKKELCLGVWGSIEALARAMKITAKSAWCNYYRTLAGRKYSRCGFAIRKISLLAE